MSQLYIDGVISKGVARELTEIVIDAMHSQVRESFGHKPRTHHKQARQQFLAVALAEGFCQAVEKRPRIIKIRKAIKQQLDHLKRNLISIDGPDRLWCQPLAAGRHAYQQLMVVSELIRQQSILYHSDSKSIPDRIASLYQAHIRPIVRGNSRCNVGSGGKISISVKGEGFTFLDRHSSDPYNECEDLKAQARANRRRHGR